MHCPPAKATHKHRHDTQIEQKSPPSVVPPRSLKPQLSSSFSHNGAPLPQPPPPARCAGPSPSPPALLLLVSAAGAGRVAASSARPVCFLPPTPSSSVAPLFHTTTTARQQRSCLPSFLTLTSTSASRRGLVMSTCNNDPKSRFHQLPILKSTMLDEEEDLSFLIPPTGTSSSSSSSSSSSRIRALVDSAPAGGSKSKKAATPAPSSFSTCMGTGTTRALTPWRPLLIPLSCICMKLGLASSGGLVKVETLYDVFVNIRNDGQEHFKTMSAMQQDGGRNGGDASVVTPKLLVPSEKKVEEEGNEDEESESGIEV